MITGWMSIVIRVQAVGSLQTLWFSLVFVPSLGPVGVSEPAPIPTAPRRGQQKNEAA